MSLGTAEWFLIVLLTVFLSLVYLIVFRSRSEQVRERIEGMEAFTTGTDEDRLMNKSIVQRMYIMLSVRVERMIGQHMKSGKLRPMKVKLIQAGDYDTEPIQHFARRIIWAAGGLLLGLIVFKTDLMMILVFGGIGVWMYDNRFKEKLRKRQMKLKSELPDFLDLLAATAPSAKSLDDAIKKVCQRMEGEVTLEFQRTLEEINAGRRQRDALNDFALRCGLPEVETFVSQVNQAEIFGTGVEKTLLMQAEKMRKLKKDLAEMKAKKASVMLLLPTLFLLITILIIIVGPSIVQFIEAMKMF